jgi:hypothetical protein
MYDDDGGFDFVFDNKQKARKDHLCGECERTISPGEEYERVFGSWEGSISTHKTCSDCLSVRDAFFCSYAFGQVWSDLKEILSDYNETDDCLAKNVLKCTPKAREKISDILEDRGGDYASIKVDL